MEEIGIEEFNKLQKQPLSLGNEFHSLFLDDVSPIVNIEKQGFVHYSLYTNEFAEERSGLHQIYRELRKSKDGDVLSIRIASNGGYLDEGKQIINIINDTFGALDTYTYIDSHAYSMGAIMFCAGATRIAYENSSIMFHNYSAGFGGKGSDIRSHFEHNDADAKSLFKSNIKGLSEDDMQRMFDGAELFYHTREMCEKGICTHVVVDSLLFDAESYIKLLDIHEEKSDTKCVTIQEYINKGFDFIQETITPIFENTDVVNTIMSDELIGEDLRHRTTGLIHVPRLSIIDELSDSIVDEHFSIEDELFDSIVDIAKGKGVTATELITKWLTKKVEKYNVEPIEEHIEKTDNNKE
jgi:ATP-dependent protease ClpP protease subunit